MASYIEFENVTRSYDQDAADTVALSDASFTVERCEFCVIIGPSGAGKTTALNVLGGIDRCSSGTVLVDGKDITAYNDKRLTLYRRNTIGFVFQSYNLVPTLSALENVQLAADICKNPFNTDIAFELVGLTGKENSFPAQLSGGEQQRVAIARAIIKRPGLLLCDEPTGALDDKTGRQILQLLQGLTGAIGATVIIITHNLAIAQMATKVIHMRNGTVESIETNAQPKNAAEIIL
jgi:putative ABC transport system ATP-binding protein